jgi:hypothetical protein
MVLLALCAATAGAALAHATIDVIGDYVLSRDTYDYVSHGSRELVTFIALLLAVALVAGGLGKCCEIATFSRAKVTAPSFGLRAVLAAVSGACALSVAIVPAMECLDGLLNGIPVRNLSDAFGGSMALGLGTTAICAMLIAALVFVVARWLISHRDTIAGIIETLISRRVASDRPARGEVVGQLFAPRRPRTPHALKRCKRGPPCDGILRPHLVKESIEGDSYEITSFFAHSYAS